MKIAILASGNGSNAEALMHFSAKNQKLVEVALVLTNKKDAGVIKRCQRLGVASGFFDNEKELLLKLNDIKPDWIFLAGFMKILSAEFLNNYYDENLKINRVINIHPALLPLYPGLNSYERAFVDSVKEGGVTIHLVDNGVDSGPIIIQKSFPRLESDSLDDFKKRGLSLEHKMYTQVLEKLAKGTLELPHGN